MTILNDLVLSLDSTEKTLTKMLRNATLYHPISFFETLIGIWEPGTLNRRMVFEKKIIFLIALELYRQNTKIVTNKNCKYLSK